MQLTRVLASRHSQVTKVGKAGQDIGKGDSKGVGAQIPAGRGTQCHRVEALKIG